MNVSSHGQVVASGRSSSRAAAAATGRRRPAAAALGSDDSLSNRHRAARARLGNSDSDLLAVSDPGPAMISLSTSLSRSLSRGDRERMMTIEGLVCRYCRANNPLDVTIHSGSKALACVTGHIGGSRPCRESGLGFTSVRIPYGSQDRLIGGSAPVGLPRAHSDRRDASARAESDGDLDSAGKNILCLHISQCFIIVHVDSNIFMLHHITS